MFVYEFRELSFFLQHGSLWRFILAAFLVGQRLSFLALDVLPADFELVLVLIVARLVSCVVYPDEATTDFSATQVVDS